MKMTQPTRTSRTVFLLPLLALAAATAASGQAGESPPVFLFEFGGPSIGDAELATPWAIDVDPAGDFVYVTDGNLARVKKFDVDGNLITTWGEPGFGAGVFRASAGLAAIRGIAVNPANSLVYVADSNDFDIEIFDTNGNYQSTFGGFGTGPGQFRQARGIDFDAAGNLYVADRSNHRVSKFDAAGNFLLDWGTRGTGQGQFEFPHDLAVDINGFVYVADSGNDRIQKFDAIGNFISQWGTTGAAAGQLDGPTSVDVSADGTAVYVAELDNHRVQRFDTVGNFQIGWGSQGSAPGQFQLPRMLAVDAAGNVYVTEAGQRVQKFDANGALLLAWGEPGVQPEGLFYTNLGIAADPATGDIYVGDSLNHRVQKFDNGGNLLFAWGQRCVVGTDDGGDPNFCNGGFFNANRIGVDSSSSVYVLDAQNHRVQKFDASGNFLTKWGTEGSAASEFASFPFGIAVDPFDDIYVADSANHRVQKFDANGNFLLQWGSQGNLPGQFNDPRGIAADSFGNIYVADTFNHRVQKFTADGMFLREWGSFCSINRFDVGSCDGLFNQPRGISFDPAGNVYVTEPRNHRVQKFDASGNFLTRFGTPGAGPGQMFSPFAVVADAAGTIFVGDSGNHRVQAFLPVASGAGTPAGANVMVDPVDTQTGTTPVALTFDNVTMAGSTTLSSSTTGPPTPSGFQLGSPATYYDIQTTATFSGSVEVCIDYSGVAYADETMLRLLHFESPDWIDVTTSLDILNDVICGTTTSFSIFLAAQAPAVETSLDALGVQLAGLVSSGAITAATASPLEEALARARFFLERGQLHQALQALRTFERVVTVAQSTHRMSPSDAASLLASLQRIVARL